MAVYQGVRLRPASLPSAIDGVTHHPRGVTSSSTHARARVRPAGLLMAAILTGTLLGLVYLTGTLGSSATTSEIEKLGATRDALEDDFALQVIRVTTETDADRIVEKAKDLGLRKLDDPVVLRVP